MTLAGLAALAWSLRSVLAAAVPTQWLLLTGMAAVSGVAALRLQAVGATFSFGETFSFAALFLYGPAAGALTAAVDSLACRLRQGRLPFLQTVFNVAAPSLSLWMAGTLTFHVAGLPLPGDRVSLTLDLLAVVSTACLFFALESGLVATAIALDKGLSPRQVWKNLFRLWLNPIVGAYAGFLVAFFNRAIGPRFLLLVVPIPLLLYYALQTWLGRVDDQVRHLAEIARSQEAIGQRDEQLRQAQKMEAIGRLTGGVAHDFNNLLTLIHGFSELLLLTFEADDRRRADLEEVLAAAERAAGLTRQLLAFSRRQVLAPQQLALEDIVTGTGRMLRRLIGEDVVLTTVCDPELGRIRADAGQIEQVLLNLSVNARDAMPGGGRLTLTLANEAIDAAGGRSLALAPGRYVRLSVADTGCGMDADTRAHIFEPFFTTKAEGQGTGLGLATVHGIVQQSGGAIHVESEAGAGTIFHVYFPRVTDEEPAVTPEASPEAPMRGYETILLVEDDERLRVLIAKVLRRHGYVVLDAGHADAALSQARRYRRRIHLLLTDVVMPGATGPVLAGQLRTTRPDVRVLFMSGYPDEAMLRHGLDPDRIEFIQKPFSMEALTVRVRELLSRPEADADEEARDAGRDVPVLAATAVSSV